MDHKKLKERLKHYRKIALEHDDLDRPGTYVSMKPREVLAICELIEELEDELKYMEYEIYPGKYSL